MPSVPNLVAQFHITVLVNLPGSVTRIQPQPTELPRLLTFWEQLHLLI